MSLKRILVIGDIKIDKLSIVQLLIDETKMENKSYGILPYDILQMLGWEFILININDMNMIKKMIFDDINGFCLILFITDNRYKNTDMNIYHNYHDLLINSKIPWLILLKGYDWENGIYSNTSKYKDRILAKYPLGRDVIAGCYINDNQINKINHDGVKSIIYNNREMTHYYTWSKIRAISLSNNVKIYEPIIIDNIPNDNNINKAFNWIKQWLPL